MVLQVTNIVLTLPVFSLLFAISAVLGKSVLQVRIQPVGNVVKGRLLSRQPEVQLVVDEVPDLFNDRYVQVSLSSNPTGSILYGSTKASLRMGTAKFLDLKILPGGKGFTFLFNSTASDGSFVSVSSAAFDCDGQEASLRVVRQPYLTLRRDSLPGVAPVIEIVDSNGVRLRNANPVISVALERNPVDASFTPDSQTTVSAVGGVANFLSLWTTKAATAKENFLEYWKENHGFADAGVFNIRFYSPGFEDVVSANFEVNPVVSLAVPPYSDTILVSRYVCGGLTTCSIQIFNYIQPDDKVQSATLDIDVGCTDLDAADEYITSVTVANTSLAPNSFNGGPWAACAYAGCRTGECPDQGNLVSHPGNTRKVLSQMDLLPLIGSTDPRTGLYSSSGPAIPVALEATPQVNLCACSGQTLFAVVTLRLTISARAEAQLLPLFQQPVVELLDGDGSRYTFASKLVAASILVNPSLARLAGATRVASASGVAVFTDLVVTEGGPAYVLRFSIANGTRYADSPSFGVGFGNFPLLSLSCLDLPCAQPLAKVNSEGSVLFLPPKLALQRRDGTRTPSALAVTVRVGVNGPGGRLKGPSTRKLADGSLVNYCVLARDGSTVLCTSQASDGAVTFDQLSLFNGNCANSLRSCQQAGYTGTCGAGYTLIFTSNGVAVESLTFDVAGANRSPQWIAPTPPDGAVLPAVVGRPFALTLNASDANFNRLDFCETTGRQRDVQFACTSNLAAQRLGPADLWGSAVSFSPVAAFAAPSVAAWTLNTAGDTSCDITSPASWSRACLCSPANFTGLTGGGVTVTVTPRCGHAPAVYPSAPAAWPLCFYAYDAGLKDASQNPVQTSSLQRCLSVPVSSPSAPAFLQPYLRDQASPDLSVPPAGRFSAQIGCRLSVVVVAADLANRDSATLAAAAQAGASLFGAAGDAGLGSRVGVEALWTVGANLYEEHLLPTPLPPGASLSSNLSSVSQVLLEWVPRRGQEGSNYAVCLAVASRFVGCNQTFFHPARYGLAGQFCLRITVDRCRYCALEGDSLERVAAAWSSHWLQLWGGSSLPHASLMMPGTPLDLGPTYAVHPGETLGHLAQKFGVTVAKLASWNPDLAAAGAILAETPLEDAPETGLAQLDLHNNPLLVAAAATRLTDVPAVQEVCALPSICVFTPLVTASSGAAAAAPQQEDPFTCDQCGDGTFCTGPCLRWGPGGVGALCLERQLSRCDRCRACTPELLDPLGQVAVAGTFKSGGCAGTVDTVCSSCSRCGAGLAELAACTPLADRQCSAAPPRPVMDVLPV